jgi:PAS domain S-box-containing protein
VSELKSSATTNDQEASDAAWLHQLMETMPNPVAMYSDKGELVFINKAFSECFGWTFDEMRRGAAQFISSSERDDSQRFVDAVLAGQSSQAVQTKRMTKEGQSREILWSVTLCYGAEGLPIGYLEVFHDITAEQRNKKRLETLLEVATKLPGLATLDEVLSYLAEIIKKHLQAESASVMLVDRDRDRDRDEIFFRMVRPPTPEMEERFEEIRFPADQGVAGYVVQTGEALFVPDLSKDDRFYSKVDELSGFVSRDLVYAPLRTGQEVTGVLGALNKIEGSFDSHDVDFMVMLAHTVSLSVEKARAMEAQQIAEKALRESLKEKEVLLQEIHHRVKNNMQVIASMLGIQKSKITDPLAKRVFSQSQDRIWAMAMVHESVYQSGTFASIQFNEYVRTLCNALYRSYCTSPRKVQMVVQVESASLGLDIAVPLGLVLNELVTNAFKHGFPDEAEGEVRVVGRVLPDGLLELEVSDTGAGFPSGLDIANTYGLYMVRGLVERQLKGSLEFGANENGKGARVVVKFKIKD